MNKRFRKLSGLVNEMGAATTRRDAATAQLVAVWHGKSGESEETARARCQSLNDELDDAIEAWRIEWKRLGSPLDWRTEAAEEDPHPQSA